VALALWAAQPGAAVTRSELVTYLKSLEQPASALHTIFTATTLERRPLREGDTWPAQGWDEARPTSRFRYEWTTVGGLVRVHCRFGSELGEHPSFPGQEASTVVWTGDAWHRRSVAVDPDTGEPANRYRVETRPSMTPPEDCLSLFNGGIRWISIVGAKSPSEVVRTYDLRDRAVDGNVVSFVLSPPSLPQKQVTISVDTVPALRLQSIVLEFVGDVKLKTSFHVDAWAAYDGVLLPQRAHRVGASSGAARCTVFEREMAVVLNSEVDHSDRFEPPQAELGDVVRDRTLKIVYEIGERYLHLDGQLFELPEPIDERVTDLLSLGIDAEPRPEEGPGDDR
jgi:hypothetical protein